MAKPRVPQSGSARPTDQASPGAAGRPGLDVTRGDTDLHIEPHHGSARTYLAVFLGLILLTMASFAIANTPLIMRTPLVGWTLMGLVSCLKAILVVLFFMHLKWEAAWKYVLTIPTILMAVFMTLMLVPDIGWRTASYSEERWLDAAHPRTKPFATAEGDSLGQPGPGDVSGAPDPAVTLDRTETRDVILGDNPAEQLDGPPPAP